MTEQRKIGRQSSNAVFESFPYPLLLIDAQDYSVFFANSAARPSGRADARTCYELLHRRDSPCSEDGHLCPLKEITRTKRPTVIEHVHRDETGEKTHVKIHGSPIFDSEGRVALIVEYVLDRTGQIKVEEALRINEAENALRISEAENARRLKELDQIYNLAPVGLLHLDRDYRIVRINQRLADDDGRSVEEHTGKTIDEIVPELADNLKEIYRPVFERGEPVIDIEIHGKTPKDPGIERDWLASYYPLKNDSGEVTGLLGGVVEITARKKAEKQVAETNSLLEAVLTNTPTQVALLDAQFNFVWVNPAYANGTQYEQSFFPGKNHFDLYPNEKSRIVFQRVVDTGVPYSTYAEPFEHPNRPPPETTYWDWSLVPVKNVHGSVSEIVLTLSEVTARIRAEKEREQILRQYNEELEEVVEQRAARIRELERQRAEVKKIAATGRMAAGIAHEINNPLAGIKNSLYLLKSAIPNSHPDHKYLGLVNNEINRIANIVRQMYALYKPDQEISTEILPSELICNVIQLVEAKSRQREVDINLTSSTTGHRVRIPVGAMIQILYNLLLNAIDASPPGGAISIGESIESGSLTITIQDSGAGIPEEIKSKIFEPFFSTKREESVTGGLGLGLSVSHSLVQSIGGCLTFESTVDEGSSFHIVLPVHPGGDS